MTPKPAESAVERYYALEWVPDGDMGFDPGGREGKAAADVADAARAAAVAASDSDQVAAEAAASATVAARAAEADLSAILKTYLGGTNEWCQGRDE